MSHHPERTARNVRPVNQPPSYNKLWHLLIDKKMRKSDLLNATGISPATLAKMTHDEDVTTATLTKICVALHCNIGDIMEVKDVEPLNT